MYFEYAMIIDKPFDDVYFIIPLSFSEGETHKNVLFEEKNNITKLEFDSKEVSKEIYEFFVGGR